MLILPYIHVEYNLWSNYIFHYPLTQVVDVCDRMVYRVYLDSNVQMKFNVHDNGVVVCRFGLHTSKNTTLQQSSHPLSSDVYDRMPCSLFKLGLAVCHKYNGQVTPT